MAESAVLEEEAAVKTGRLLHKAAVTEAGVKRKVISYSNGEVRCSTSEPCRCCCCCCSSLGSTDIDKEASEFSDLEEESGDILASTYGGLESCRERRRETMPLSDVIADESFDLKEVTAAELPPSTTTDGNSSSSLLFNNEASWLTSASINSTTQELENLVPVVVVAGDDDVNSSRRRSKKVKMPSNAELEDFFSVTENDLMRQFTHRYNFDFVKEEPFEGRYEWVPVPVSYDDQHVV